MNDNTEALPPLPEAYEAVEHEIVNRFRVEPRHSGFWPYCVKAGDGAMELFIGHKTKCEEVAQALRTACLDGAFMASRAALAQRQQVPEARMRETLEFIAQHFSSDWPERCQSHVLAARHCLTAAPSAQAEPLQLIPDSALVVARKTLEGKSGVDFLEGWVEFVAILGAAPLAAQAEPQVPQAFPDQQRENIVALAEEYGAFQPADARDTEDGLRVRFASQLGALLSASPQAPAQRAVEQHLLRARAMMQAFCDRVEAGQVRSVKTYSAFKAFLEETKP